jgi:hypothetical protein
LARRPQTRRAYDSCETAPFDTVNWPHPD